MARTRLGGHPSFQGQIIESITSAVTLTNKDSGRLFLINASTGFTITLPPARIGMNFRFAFDVGGTDGAMLMTVGDALGYFYGRFLVTQSDAGDTLASQVVVKATAAATPTSYDYMLFDGDATATGGDVGSYVEIVCTVKDGWLVRAHLGTSGTPASIATIYAGA